MNSIVYITRLFLLAMVCNVLFSQQVMAWKPDYVPPPEQLKQLEKRNDKRRTELNTSALIFGKVIDFSGEPVAGAKVTMRLSVIPNSVLNNDQRLVSTVTDSTGAFQFEEIGFIYYLVGIECNGYQFKMDYIKERSLSYKPGVKASGKGYEKDQAMVFRIRKRLLPHLHF